MNDNSSFQCPLHTTCGINHGESVNFGIKRCLELIDKYQINNIRNVAYSANTKIHEVHQWKKRVHCNTMIKKRIQEMKHIFKPKHLQWKLKHLHKSKHQNWAQMLAKKIKEKRRSGLYLTVCSKNLLPFGISKLKKNRQQRSPQQFRQRFPFVLGKKNIWFIIHCNVHKKKGNNNFFENDFFEIWFFVHSGNNIWIV